MKVLRTDMLIALNDYSSITAGAEGLLNLIRQIRTELIDCRNELCEKCGKNKEKESGACAGCRWEE